MSKNYQKVKQYYDAKLWTVNMVRNAVGRWITAEEFLLIIGNLYEEKEGR